MDTSEYILIVNTVQHELDTVIEYGICVIANSCGKKIVIDSIPNISVNIEFLIAMVKLFNELELSPIHFRDVLEDYIS